MNKLLYLSLALIFLFASAQENTETTVTVEESTTTVATEETVNTEETVVPVESGETAPMESGETTVAPNVPQTTTPITVFPSSLLTTFAVDIHYLSGAGLNSSYIAYHYCNQLGNGLFQCDVYNGTDNYSRLTGVEMIVTNDTLMTFDEEERKLWYPHAFEILNGFFVVPNLSPQDELTLLGVLINTYGKSTDFYSSNLDFPLGAPQAAFGWINSDQVNTTLASEIDTTPQLNLTTTFAQRAAARQGLVAPGAVSGVDSWTADGQSPQYEVFTIAVNQTTNNPQ